jgi:hypothetical protein
MHKQFPCSQDLYIFCECIVQFICHGWVLANWEDFEHMRCESLPFLIIKREITDVRS